MAESEREVRNIDCVTKMASANSKFGFDLYKKLATERKDGNIFLSPFSISAALGMTHLGARGDTSTQMNQVLNWTNLRDTVHFSFEDYLQWLNKKRRRFVVTTANRLFISNKHELLEEFLKKTKQHYGASAVLADFAGDGSGEADRINKWVEGETNNKIKDLISGGIDPMTAMIIVNAIYFKGRWEQPFTSSNTAKGIFKVGPNETVELDMMKMERRFNFAKSDKLKCSILELPYKGKDLSMMCLLPFADDGLASLEQIMDQDSLSDAFKEVQYVNVNVTLPRFALESNLSLNDVLKELGMTDAFDESIADLSGIDGSRQLYISEVVHKAFLEVNEEGSEAAAATGAGWVTLSISQPFTADHPFFLLVRDNRTGMILFMGRFIRPSAQ